MHSSPTLDAEHPPEAKLIDACVHCGFCLSTCPSYRVLGTEMDSPRGRIYMMDALNQGEIDLTPAVVSHFDSCLGCLACTTTCPSGVQYDKLIASMRPQIERNHQRPLVERLYRQFIFGLFPYPNRLRLLLVPLFIYQKLGLQKLVRQTGIVEKISPHLAGMESNLPELSLSTFQETLPALIPAKGKQRYRVGMITGCVQKLFFDRVNQATVRVLTANGCEVIVPPNQGCCAALPHHQGQEEQARTLARQTIDKFIDTNVDVIIINAAGCGHTLKEYGELLQDDAEYHQKAIDFAAKVRDVQEFLAEIELTTKLLPISTAKLTLVYQDACHLLHGQKISMQPRQLLNQIPNVELKEPLDAAICCGSAGVYNMLQPETANELGRQKVNNLVNTGATIIASANPGCTLQIAKHLETLEGYKPRILHPIELLDYAISGVMI
jgi:glycolate oxidase iron-sulfur subunit